MRPKVISLNSYGLNSLYKCRTLWMEAKRLKGDVICIQKTQFWMRKPLNVLIRSTRTWLWPTPLRKKRGVFMAIKHSVTYKQHDIVVDPQGWYLILVCNLNNTTYTTVNVYTPNTGQAKILWKVLKKVKPLQRGLILRCGNFNSLLDPQLDMTAFKKSYSRHLQTFLQDAGLYNSWKSLHRTEPNRTLPFSAPPINIFLELIVLNWPATPTKSVTYCYPFNYLVRPISCAFFTSCKAI